MIATAHNQTKILPKPPIRDAEHYRHLFGRTKWYLIISGPLALVASAVYLFLFMHPENPKLSTRALIGLERPTDVSGLKVGAASNLGREDIMMSRTFLRDVVQKLSLQVWTKPYAREVLFNMVKIDSSALSGTYSVHFNPRKKGEYYILYYDTNAISLPLFGVLPGTKFKSLVAGNFSRDSVVHLPGMNLKFSRTLRARPKDFDFSVVDIRVAVEDVFRNLTIKRADPDKGLNYITVLLESRDYGLAASITNAIADAFIEKNFSYRQQRAQGIVGSLDSQLSLSQANLAAADEKIREFRSLNPQVGLNQQAQLTVSTLAHLDNGIQSRSTDNFYADNLRKEFQNPDSTQATRNAQVVVDFLSAHSVPEGPGLKEELDRLMLNQSKLAETYGPEHPIVIENNHNIAKAVSAIKKSLNDFIEKGKTEISEKNQSSQQLSSRLRQLPALEMELGGLQRKQQIYSDIYSAVLSSYNKAKVEDAVAITDFYVMDYAVAPLPPPVDNTQLFFLFGLLSIMISFGPVIISDIFDKSVRSPRQLERITGRQVLESVPVFHQLEENEWAGKFKFRPLITVPTHPTFIREIFDALQVKINLHLLKSSHKIIVVSSLEDGAGKSTISSNLAISYAMRGHRTLLVDGDLRRGTVGLTFNLKDSAGFASMLALQNPLTDDDCLRYIVKSSIPNLFVIPASLEAKNPGALLSSPRMAEFKQFCIRQMDYVVIDTAPLGAVSDAAVIQDNYSNYLFVIQAGKTHVAELVNRINEFDQLSGKILGYVMNKASLKSLGSYQKYSSYYLH